ncbi:MAG: CcmD family protein [Chloroflexi bacterium]|nr:CcmD family protein [Chloroflexota bacterium]
MIYLAAAYGVIWLAVFILVFSMNRRQSQLNEELTILEEMIRDQN